MNIKDWGSRGICVCVRSLLKSGKENQTGEKGREKSGKNSEKVIKKIQKLFSLSLLSVFLY
jgi:hypothetical protein